MGPAHFGIGFAAKPSAPKVPLWLLLVASEILDLLSFGFIATDIEEFGATKADLKSGMEIITPSVIHWSHGLFMSIVWSLVVGVIAFIIFRDLRVSGILGIVVFSHWLLDFIVHAPDLPLFFANSPKVGLGLWTSGPGFVASILLELTLLVGGIAIYTTIRKRKVVKESTV